LRRGSDTIIADRDGCDWHPGKLWSLWDFMKRFEAGLFVALSRTLESWTWRARLEESGVLDENDKSAADSIFADFENDCIELELGNCLFSAKRLRAAFAHPETTIGSLLPIIEELHGRLADTLREKTVLSMGEKEAALYRDPWAGWVPILEQFPNAMSDVEEASKCLAFDRHTACVFHLMRVVEVGIRSVARCLNIPDPVKPAERNWGIILKTIKEEMERRSTASPIGWPNLADAAFFDQCYSSLDAVKNAWRNPTIHIENKYTGEEAEDILGAVRGFMRRLVSRMDQQGQPKA
jgi:hypothetical protein